MKTISNVTKMDVSDVTKIDVSDVTTNVKNYVITEH